MKRKRSSATTRREFILMSSALAATSVLGSPSWGRPKARKSAKPNILFIFTDQERHFDKMPTAFSMPGHDRLARLGTTFSAHHISATMCTSSRSVMLTGLQTADTKMFDNTDTPYIGNMSTQIPTLGTMLRKVGYHTAYKGKWHLSRDFELPSQGGAAEAAMNAYGFSDFSSPGDQAAHTLGGYQHDEAIAGSVISWLRGRGQSLSAAGTPWSMTVSLVNPHDIMYFNADAPNENVQDNGKLLMHAARAPETAWYANDWHQPVPSNLRQSLTQAGRPAAHAEFDRAWDYCLGNIPLKDANWRRFTNFYLNSMRMVDMHVNNILMELENLGLLENTIVVFTADHGEAGGHHGLRGKGPFAYKETLHVPFYMIHPDVQGGSVCNALTSHIDIVPSLLTLAGASAAEITQYAGRVLPGKDMSGVLTNPAGAGVHDVRDKALFTYSSISTNDAEVIRIISEAKARGEDPKEAMKRSGYKPNFKKRGSLRTMFDGQYKFTRYFAPTERNSPKNFADLIANNDLEVFDLAADPSEMNNLAVRADDHQQLFLDLNDKLEGAIAHEIGVDDGREMPDFPGIDWSLDQFDL